ncbi:hypothetical protein HYN69_01205 [Gemmobacter aquarius]|uniref:GAF domain-containing protein n=1 Tax=Paragemmobacter aquarius TaxID=2169400 RepID=A0A2S0UHL7_9RHOB|nr:hypothetical protein [Gemmobacter aquarius]AWB47306.1 hypothetical protein HYN69_01205 [Gemmobacter aquarius]
MAVAQFYGAKAEAADAAGQGQRIVALSDFGAVADLARAISGAGGACIRVGEGAAVRIAFYPAREGVTDLPAALLRGEKAVDVAQEPGVAGLPGVQFWAGFPLRAPSGVVLGLLGVMDDAPLALSQGVIGQLQGLADVLARQVLLAEAAVAVLARRSLQLIEDVSEVDDSAASPVLRGLLRFACGETPNSTEAMALRIAGLAEAKAGKLVLTAVAEGILAQQGFDRGVTEAELPEAVSAAVVRPGDDFSPMARLRIGEQSYDMARSEAIEALAFRVTGTDAAWQVLENGLEEGWPEIIAEVLRKTRDVVMDYVRMHMIHERDVTLPEGQYRYDLYGMSWTLRGTPDHAEVSVNGGSWLAFDASGVSWDQPRDLSARAAIAGYPDIGDRIGADVHEWCKRIAAGSEVTPIF